MKKQRIDFDNEEDLKQTLDRLFKKIDVVELLILKSHLLIEFSLNHFILKRSKDKTINIDNFTFNHKIKLCKILGLFLKPQFDDLESFVTGLNTIRNQIAHSLDYDENLLKKICFQGNDNPDKRITLKSQLKGMSIFCAGRIVGRASAYDIVGDEKMKN